MRRVLASLWVLVATASVALGLLTRALSWPAGPGAGATVAASGVALVASVALALRILVVLGRASGSREEAPCGGGTEAAGAGWR